MTSINNSNFRNLFTNYQNQQAYQKKKYDVNGDGKTDSKDKKALTNEQKALLNDSKLFDIDGDGILTQDDIDMFQEFDFNNDGIQSADELNFISAFKKELVKDFKSAKADFEIDGVKYEEGKVFNGIMDGKYYKSGKLATGTYKNIYYSNGVPVNGIVKNVLYQNGVKFTGVNTSDGLYYKNGKVANGTVTEGNTTCNYKKGVVQYSITDNNGKDFPKISGQYIQCKNGNKNIKIKLNIGEIAVINADGTINITDKDGKIKQYSSDGNLLENSVKKDLGGLFQNYQNETKKTDVTGDGKFDSADKNILNANEAAILKESMLFDIDKDKQLSQNDIDLFMKGDFDGDGKISEEEKAAKDAFIKEYKDDLQKAFNNIKADYKLDNKQYFNGKEANGDCEDGLHYTKGVKTNGCVKEQLYINGEKSKLTGEHTDGKYYNEGKLANGVQENGLHYTKGIKTNGVGTENGEKYFYKDGVKGAGQAAGDEKNEVFVYGEDGKYHHSVKGIWIKNNGDYKRTYVENPSDRCSEPNKLFFKGRDQETHFIEIEQGDEIRILDSGAFYITRDGIQYSYNEVGNCIECKEVGTTKGGVNPPNIDGVPPTNSPSGTTPTTPTAPTDDTSIDLPEWVSPMTPPKNILAPGAVGSIEYISDVIGLTENDINNNYSITKDAAGRITKLESKTGTPTVYNFEYRSNDKKEDEISKITKNITRPDGSYSQTCEYSMNVLTKESEVWKVNSASIENTWTEVTTHDGKSDKQDFISHCQKRYSDPDDKSAYEQTTYYNYANGESRAEYLQYGDSYQFGRNTKLGEKNVDWAANGILKSVSGGTVNGVTEWDAWELPLKDLPYRELDFDGKKAWELEKPEINQ